MAIVTGVEEQCPVTIEWACHQSTAILDLTNLIRPSGQQIFQLWLCALNLLPGVVNFFWQRNSDCWEKIAFKDFKLCLHFDWMTLLKVNGHLQHEIGSLVNSSWCYVYGQMLLHNINAHSNILKLLSLNKIKPNDVTIHSYLATNFPFRLKVRYSKRKVYALLDKVMSRNQWHIGVHQHHLMFKGHWRAPHETIYSHKKKMCLEKNHFHWVISCFIS